MHVLTPGRAALAAAVVVFAGLAGTARAAVAISLTQCGVANGGVQFTVTGTGFAGRPMLELDVTTSEPGATPNPNYIVPSGTTVGGIAAAAPLGADGSFTLRFESGAGQLLPAAVTISAFDPATYTTGAVLYTGLVNAATACADGTGFFAAKTTVPKTQLDCTSDGWRTYGFFATQGDCVSFVSTRGKNAPVRQP